MEPRKFSEPQFPDQWSEDIDAYLTELLQKLNEKRKYIFEVLHKLMSPMSTSKPLPLAVCFQRLGKASSQAALIISCLQNPTTRD